VHLAAIPAPGLTTNGATFANNIAATHNVCSAARRAGIRSVVWASSETVLGLPFGDRSDHDASTPRSAQGGRPASDQESGINGAVTPGSETVDRAEPVGRRRRGRVTRTAGAPTAVTGDAPTVAVVTVPSARTAEEHAGEPGAGDVATPPAPEPVLAPRARRVRRTASRPAGPPAPDASGAETSGEAAPQ